MGIVYQQVYPQYQNYKNLSTQISDLESKIVDDLEDPSLEIAQGEIRILELGRTLTLSKQLTKLKSERLGLPQSFDQALLEKIPDQLSTLMIQEERYRQMVINNDRKIKLLEEISKFPGYNPEDLIKVDQDLMATYAMPCPNCGTHLHHQGNQLVVCKPISVDREHLLKQKAHLQSLAVEHQKILQLKTLVHAIPESRQETDPQPEIIRLKSEKIKLEKLQKDHQKYLSLTEQIDILGNVDESQEIETSIGSLKTRMSELALDKKRFQERQAMIQTLDRLRKEREKYPSSCPQPGTYDLKKDLLMAKAQIKNILEEREKYPWIDLDKEEVTIKASMERAQCLKEIAEVDKSLSLETDLSIQENDIKTIQDRIDLLTLSIKKLTDYATERSRLNTTIISLKGRLVPDSDILTMTQSVEYLKMAQKKYLEDHQLIQIQNNLLQVSQIYQEHTGYSEQERILQTRLSQLTKIRSTILMAEYVILDTVLTRINGYLERLLGDIFPDPIRVRLRSLRKMKTQDRIKPEINIEIEYKGTLLSHPSELSGGQYARVSIALCLSFARMGKYPFVFLDESMSGIDVTTRESIVEVLSGFFSDKLVCVVNHDTNEGAYTACIRF